MLVESHLIVRCRAVAGSESMRVLLRAWTRVSLLCFFCLASCHLVSPASKCMGPFDRKGRLSMFASGYYSV